MGVIAPRQTGSPGSQREAAVRQSGQSMRLRYGLAESDLWRQCASSNEVADRVRGAAAQIVRLSVEDECSRAEMWQRVETYISGVMAAGAVPMVTFSKFGRPYADAAAIRWFAGCCGSFVRRSIQRWGPESVREWFWCLGNQPNSEWLNAGLTFDLYRGLYEAAAESVVESLAPYLEGRKARIGGPGIDTFQPFWTDWVYRFVREIDNRLISFVVWHRYGDWREPGDWGAPKDEMVFRALLMSRVADYETRARAVGRILKGRGILNFCGELNAHSHHEPRVSDPFNKTQYGAAYYSSALIRLMCGGADGEMLRPVPSDPGPQLLAKQLCAGFIRAGDNLVFPELANARGRMEAVVAIGEDGRPSAFLANLRNESLRVGVQDIPLLDLSHRALKLDSQTNGRIEEVRFDGVLRLEGYGAAVITAREDSL